MAHETIHVVIKGTPLPDVIEKINKVMEEKKIAELTRGNPEAKEPKPDGGKPSSFCPSSHRKSESYHLSSPLIPIVS